MERNCIKFYFFCLLLVGHTACGQVLKQVNVKDYGATGDGKTNDSKAIQKAFSQLYKTGGTLYFPPGKYLSNTIDIRPTEGTSIEVKGEAGKSILIKNPNDETAVALFFCEIPSVSLSFSALQLDGSSSQTQNKWKPTANKETYDIERPIRGIYGYNLKKLEVANCSIKNFHGDGIAAYSIGQFIAHHNVVENVNGTGIKGHRVVNMTILDNKIKDTGFIPETFLVNGQLKKKSSFFPKTTFGDGIEGDCKVLVAKDNRIINPGRCGIVHDLAIDLGYQNSSATVYNNTIIVNSMRVNNGNPPAGMWFEQSANVTVEKNKVEILKSTSELVTGIRFYGITNSINCIDNSITANNYNNILGNGIGIFEPRLSSIYIKGNTISGKIAAGITISYEHKNAHIDTMRIQGNTIRGQRQSMKYGIHTYVGGNAVLPKSRSIHNNTFHNIVSATLYSNPR